MSFPLPNAEVFPSSSSSSAHSVQEGEREGGDGRGKHEPRGEANTLEDKNRFANHYKTKMCVNYKGPGTCPYGRRCRFAHGREDRRTYSKNTHEGLTSEDALLHYQRAQAAQIQHTRETAGDVHGLGRSPHMISSTSSSALMGTSQRGPPPPPPPPLPLPPASQSTCPPTTPFDMSSPQAWQAALAQMATLLALQQQQIASAIPPSTIIPSHTSAATAPQLTYDVTTTPAATTAAYLRAATAAAIASVPVGSFSSPANTFYGSAPPPPPPPPPTCTSAPPFGYPEASQPPYPSTALPPTAAASSPLSAGSLLPPSPPHVTSAVPTALIAGQPSRSAPFVGEGGGCGPPPTSSPSLPETSLLTSTQLISWLQSVLAGGVNTASSPPPRDTTMSHQSPVAQPFSFSPPTAFLSSAPVVVSPSSVPPASAPLPSSTSSSSSPFFMTPNVSSESPSQPQASSPHVYPMNLPLFR